MNSEKQNEQVVVHYYFFFSQISFTRGIKYGYLSHSRFITILNNNVD